MDKKRFYDALRVAFIAPLLTLTIWNVAVSVPPDKYLPNEPYWQRLAGYFNPIWMGVGYISILFFTFLFGVPAWLMIQKFKPKLLHQFVAVVGLSFFAALIIIGHAKSSADEGLDIMVVGHAIITWCLYTSLCFWRNQKLQSVREKQK